MQQTNLVPIHNLLLVTGKGEELTVRGHPFKVKLFPTRLEPVKRGSKDGNVCYKQNDEAFKSQASNHEQLCSRIVF